LQTVFDSRLPYFETSAATGQNVAKAIECLLDMVMLRAERSVDKSIFNRSKNRQQYEMDEASSEGGCGC